MSEMTLKEQIKQLSDTAEWRWPEVEKAERIMQKQQRMIEMARERLDLFLDRLHENEDWDHRWELVKEALAALETVKMEGG